MFTHVTTIEIPIETPTFNVLVLMKDIPILIPKDIPMRIKVKIHMKNLRSLLLTKGNPTHYHFISSGCGAFLTFTPFIGKSLVLQRFQKLAMEGGLFLSYISRRASEDLSVTKITLS